MDNGNTFDPSQFTNMADQNNQYDFSNLDVDYLLEEMDPDTFFDNTMAFEEGSAYDNSAFNEPVDLPLQTFGPPLVAPYSQSMAPMQQQYNQPAAATPFNQAVPALPPPGALHHPDIGWYFPVDLQPGAAPMLAQQQMPINPTLNATPVAGSTQVPQPNPPATNKKRRKYGPSVFTEEQAKRRAIGDDSGPRPVSRESVDYHVQGRKTKQKAGNASKPKKGSPAGPKQSELKRATVKPCNCPASKVVTQHWVSRPSNMYMIFRRSFQAHWETTEGQLRGNEQVSVSKASSEAWKKVKEDPERLAEYRRRYDQEVKEHKEMFPDYSYTPKVKIQARFGQPDCKCGAWKLNSAALDKIRGITPTPENNSKAVSIDEDADEQEYIMPVTRSQSRGNSLALTAQAPMVQQPYPFIIDDISGDGPDYDFSFPVEDTADDAEWAIYQNAANTAAAGVDNSYIPHATRRSTRSSTKTVRYAEVPSDHEEDLDLDDGDDEMANTTPRKKRRPSPISTSRSASLKMSEFVNDSSPESNGPASRTRSKSASFDESMYQEAATYDDLFGEYNDDDIGENITVATPMTGLSNVSPKNRSGLALPTTRGQSRGGK